MQLDDLPARQRILVKAHELFYRDGVRATGIDKIIAESNVAKLTFYRHYPSKDDLIRAYLGYRHELWMEWFVDALRRYGGCPGGGLRPLALSMHELFAQDSFRGCAFINVTAELGGSMPDIVEIAKRHKQDMVEAIVALLPPNQHAREIADAAALTVDGAIVRAQMSGRESALQSLNLTLKLLDDLALAS